MIIEFLAQDQPQPSDQCSGAASALPQCVIPDVVGGVATAAVKSGIEAVAEAFTKSVQPFLTAVFTYWTGVPNADLASPSNPVQLMQGSLHWLSAAIAVVALGIGATRLVLTRRPDNAVALARSMGLLFFASVIAVPLFNLLLSFGDDFSTWILSPDPPTGIR